MNYGRRRWRFNDGVLLNYRDLGGYVCDGGVVRYGQLMRSDQISGISDASKAYLISEGLKHVVDLRDDDEKVKFPNDFAVDERVTYHPCPITTGDRYHEVFEMISTCQGHDYIKRLEAVGEYYPKMITCLAAMEGMTVFHCMAGKDRTGMIAALIHMILGVEDADIIADYQITETYLGTRMEEIKALFPGLPEYKFASEAVSMRLMIDHLKKHYGGAEGYLIDRGIDRKALSLLKKKMIVEQNLGE